VVQTPSSKKRKYRNDRPATPRYKNNTYVARFENTKRSYTGVGDEFVPDQNSSEHVPHAHGAVVTGRYEMFVIGDETRRSYAAATGLDESMHDSSRLKHVSLSIVDIYRLYELRRHLNEHNFRRCLRTVQRRRS